MNNYLSVDFLISKGFSKPKRYFDERCNQFRIELSIDGYDGIIIISPVPQIVPNYIDNDGYVHYMQPCEQVDKFSDIETLKTHHIGDWNVFINSRNNHITTFNYENQLIDFMNICSCPLDCK